MACDNISYNTTTTNVQTELRRLRRRWRALHEERLRLEEIILRRERLLKGTVATIFKSCGNRRCKCQRGEKHGPFLYLSASVDGRTRTWRVPKEEERYVQRRTESYKRFRAARERLVRIQKELVQSMNQMEALRTEDVRFGGKSQRPQKQRSKEKTGTRDSQKQTGQKKGTSRMRRQKAGSERPSS